jgi:hypothetical protein
MEVMLFEEAPDVGEEIKFSYKENYAKVLRVVECS